MTKLLGKAEDGSLFDVRPGLWRWLKWQDHRPRGWKPGALPRLWPATYHQKCAIVDSKIAFIGGLDLDERRWDDAEHDRGADETWHDISSVVQGPIASDAGQNFAHLWNLELGRFREIVGQWTGEDAPDITSDPLDEVRPPQDAEPLPDGKASAQLLRTRSRNSDSVFSLGPATDIQELKAGHRKMIQAARSTLYIEAQFFRSEDAADWVVQALKDQPELELIILIANVPEEIAFLGQGENVAHRHGEYLQAKALGRLLKAGGPDRVGLFTLVRDEPTNHKEENFEDSRGTAFGSGIIYIHAKLLIADCDACLLSSANINGRSFNWDTELGFLWHQQDGAIAEFRHGLWSRLSGGALTGESRRGDWHRLAETNRLGEPEDRQGFIVPYQRSRARRFGRPHFYVPDALV